MPSTPFVCPEPAFQPSPQEAPLWRRLIVILSAHAGWRPESRSATWLLAVLASCVLATLFAERADPRLSFVLDAYELSTYTSAGVMLFLGMSLVTLFLGNLGFVVGALLKYVHSLLFHLYQHRWWGEVHVRKQATKPRRTWGFASARYHAWHHARPDEGPFTFAETWAGFDRLLELLSARTSLRRGASARPAGA